MPEWDGWDGWDGYPLPKTLENPPDLYTEDDPWMAS